MLHPFMPYVTEEIYDKLSIKDAESIMLSSYPKYDKNLVFDTNVDDILEFITMYRNKKASLGNIGEYKVVIKTNTAYEKEIITNMLKLKDRITDSNEEGTLVEYRGLSINIIFDNSNNLEEEREKLLKEKENLESSIARREKLLSNEKYVSKAPSNIVEKERESLEKEKELLDNLVKKL